MRHFVQFHNTEEQGELRGLDHSFDAWTNRGLTNLIGSTIWLIVKEGRGPRKYYLAYRFIADAIDNAPPDSGKEHRVLGNAGVLFKPRIYLNDKTWWKEFLKSQGMSGFGLNPIQAKYVEEFEALPWLKSVTREQVLYGIQRFDKECRELIAWRNWQDNPSQKYALAYEDQLYPPKLILVLGAGIRRSRRFAGEGEGRANSRLRELGFEVVPIALLEGAYLRSDESEQDETQQSIFDAYVAENRDTREFVERTIKIRRGQQAFRSALRDRYGDICLISGCDLLDVLEAAHIKPYRGKADNNVGNGLLLRADLHTLFDLNLIGVEPETLIVRVHPRAKTAGYEQFDGQRLRCTDKAKPYRSALLQRWEVFRKQSR
jgi:hypothetical protein